MELVGRTIVERASRWLVNNRQATDRHREDDRAVPRRGGRGDRVGCRTCWSDEIWSSSWRAGYMLLEQGAPEALAVRGVVDAAGVRGVVDCGDRDEPGAQRRRSRSAAPSHRRGAAPRHAARADHRAAAQRRWQTMRCRDAGRSVRGARGVDGGGPRIRPGQSDTGSAPCGVAERNASVIGAEAMLDEVAASDTFDLACCRSRCARSAPSSARGNRT